MRGGRGDGVEGGNTGSDGRTEEHLRGVMET